MRRLSSIALLLVSWPVAATAAPSFDFYPDSVRFDLSNGRRLSDPSVPATDRRGFRFDEPLRLAVARDEVIAFQIVGRGEAGDYPIVIEGFDDLVVSTFEEVGIEITSPTESGGVTSLGPGTYPDALVPTSTLTVPAPPAIGALWVDVFAPRKLEPGVRQGAIVIGTKRVGITITVLDVTLPGRDLASLGTVNFGSLLDKERADPKHLLRWMQMAHAHRVDIEIMRMTPTQADDGTIDWDGWMKRVAPYVVGTAFTSSVGYTGPRAGLPVARWIIPHTDWWPTKRTEAGLPEDPKRWSETLREWEKRVDAAGWFDRPYATKWIMFINSLDEPKTVEELASLAKYEKLLADAKLENRRRVWFRADGNFGPDYGGMSDEDVAAEIGGAVDLWNLHGASNTAPIRLIEARQGLGERAMFYASNSGGEPSIPPLVIDADIVGARAWGWITYRYQLFGALNWEVDYYKGGCVENPKCSEGGRMNLDANLIYRGEELGLETHQPIASMRLKMLRRGSQDAAIADVVARRRPDVAGRIAEILVPRALGDNVPDQGRGAWTLDPAAYDRARNAMLTQVGGGTPIPISSIRTDGKGTQRPTASGYLYGLSVVVLVGLAWWVLSRGARNRA